MHFIDMLIEDGRLCEAAIRFHSHLSANSFRIKTGENLWEKYYKKYLDVLVQSATSKRQSSDSSRLQYPLSDDFVSSIFRDAMDRFKSREGLIWSMFATYFVRKGESDMAKKLYEEALSRVKSVRDFSLVFDAFAMFQEMQLGKLLKRAAKNPDSAEIREESDRLLEAFQALLDRRELFLNDVLLRKAPNNVAFWLQRVAILLKAGPEDDLVLQKAHQTYADALMTIDPKKASNGLVSDIFIAFAKQINSEAAKSGEQAKDSSAYMKAICIYEKGVDYPFKSVQELGQLWIAYGELVKSVEGREAALAVLARATKPLVSGYVDYFDDTLPVQQRVHKNIKVWEYILSLEKEIGSRARLCATFDTILDLKLANIALLLDYASTLECTFHDLPAAFKVYSRGIELFGYPSAFALWNVYLPKIIQYYEGKNTVLVRDLFEEALTNVPKQYAKPICILYGAWEEQHGQKKKALSLYERAVGLVKDEEQLAMYEYWLAKTLQHDNFLAMRPIYQKALQTLGEQDAQHIALRFSKFEEKLGELERARAIYAFGAQLANPEVATAYWDKWQEFELLHGNQDTFREMLRVKRAIQSQFKSTLVQFVPSSTPAPSQSEANPMQRLEE
jgi:pre-mRNA-splicing factor SYF1